MNQTIRSNRYFLFVFLYFLLFPFLSTTILIFPILFSWDNALISAIQQTFIFLPLLFLYPILSKTPIKECFSFHRIRFFDALLCICIAAFLQPFMSLLVFLTSFLQPNFAEQAMESFQGSGFFLPLLSLAILPAVFEEMLFRGIALHTYSHLGKMKAILISAFLFALLHMNLQQASYAFILGGVFAFLVQRTGSLFASLLPHFCINAFNWSMMYFAKPEMQEAAELSTGATLLGLGLHCIFALPFLVGLFYLFIKRTTPNEALLPEESHTKAETNRFFTPSIICIILLFLLFGVLPTVYH